MSEEERKETIERWSAVAVVRWQLYCPSRDTSTACVVCDAHGGSPGKSILHLSKESNVGQGCVCVRGSQENRESEMLEQTRVGGAGTRRMPTLFPRRFFVQSPSVKRPLQLCVCGCPGVGGLWDLPLLACICTVPGHHTDAMKRTAYRRLREEVHWCASGSANQCPAQSVVFLLIKAIHAEKHCLAKRSASQDDRRLASL
jgi:hypothetical protein